MEIYRNKKLEEQIFDASREFLLAQERSEGLHFSDLLTPRIAYYKITDPQPISAKEIGFFIAGRAHHEVILAIMRRQKKIGAPEDVSKVWEEVAYTPDYNLGFLAEIKTTRRQWEPADRPETLTKAYKQYLGQLTQYMAAENKQTSALIVFYISLRMDDKNKTTVPSLRAYQVEMTKQELASIRLEMRVKKKNLLHAIKVKAPGSLPLCPAWMCCSGGYRGPATASCKWYEKCKPQGRYPEALYAENRKKGDFDDD